MTYYTADHLYADGQLLDGHYMLVEDGLICEVAPLRQLPPRAYRDMVAFEDAVLIPGLVNSHTHSYQALMKGMSGDRQPLTHDYVATAARFAFCQLLRQGVTTVCDFLDLDDPDNAFAQEILAAAQETGIRLSLVKALPTREQPPTPAALDHWLTSLDTLAESLPATAGLCQIHAGIGGWPHAGVAETFQAVQQWSSHRQTRYFHHLTPSHHEREASYAHYGAAPVVALERLGLLDPLGVGVHATWLDDEELALLSQQAPWLVMTPSTSLSLGEGCPRLSDALTQGIQVGLGTGGWVRNNRGSILDEIRLVTLLQMSAFRRQAPLRPQQMLGLATDQAARVLDRPVGRLAKGCHADFVVLDLNDWSLHPHTKLMHHLAFSIATTAITAVYVAGKRLVDTGELLSVNEAAIMRQVRQTVEANA